MRIGHLALLMLAALFVGIFAGYKITDNRWQTKWAHHIVEDAKASKDASDNILKLQTDIITERNNANIIAAKLQENHKLAIAAANASADSLREQIARIKALPTTSNTGSIRSSAAAATDRLVLAELLGRADATAQRMAEYAEENRMSAINCRNEYNAIVDSFNKGNVKDD